MTSGGELVVAPEPLPQEAVGDQADHRVDDRLRRVSVLRTFDMGSAPPEGHRSGAREKDGEIAPLLLRGSGGEEAVQATKEPPELPVVQAVDDDASRMSPPGLCPGAQQGREILNVVCHEDAVLLDRQPRHVFVVQTLQRRFVRQRTDIVPALGERGRHDPTGHMRVQQQSEHLPYCAASTTKNG
ncbi:hypothetical protein BH23ACT7_BH23ACT7_08550 [soil metagenome]